MILAPAEITLKKAHYKLWFK